MIAVLPRYSIWMGLSEAIVNLGVFYEGTETVGSGDRGVWVEDV